MDWVSLFPQYLLRAVMYRALGCDPRDVKKYKGVYGYSWIGMFTYHIFFFYNSKNMEMA